MDLIYKKIPHRPPFLFLDTILEVTDNTAKAERLIRADEPQFEGHYPNNPIMPGVLLCEGLFQLGAYYLASTLEKDNDTIAKKTPVLSRILEAKFKKIVRPGDTIVLEVNFKEKMGGFYFLRGSISKEGKAVMTAEFVLALVDETS